MKKIFWIGGIVILSLIVAGAFVAASSLDGIIKAGVETFGPRMTKTSINLDSVHISLLTGSASVKGLVVGNPKSYKTAQAISVGLAAVGINPFSILSDKIIVRTVHVESPEITFEGGLGGNNLSTILANVNEFTKTGGMPSTNAAASQPGRKIEVDDFLITGARVHVSITGLGGKETTLPLPDIHLTDLGKSTDGLTPADLTRAVLKAVTAAAVKAVAAGAADLGKNAGALGKDAAKDAAEGLDKIKNGLGGLLGK